MKITKSLLLLGFIFLAGTACYAQSLSRFTENGKVGYRNAAGEVIVAAQYSAGSEMTAEGAVVTLNGKSGFINAQGKVIIPLMFDEASAFVNGRALVRNGNAFYFIDTFGEKVGDASQQKSNGGNQTAGDEDPTRN